MATTYRTDQSKYWFARFTDRNGKRVSRTTKSESRREAKIIAGKLEAAERDAVKNSDIPRILQRAVEHASLEAQSGILTLQRAEDLIRQMTQAAYPTAAEGCFRRFAAAWLDRTEPEVTPETAVNYHRTIKTAVVALGDKAEEPLRKLTPDDAAAIQAAFGANGACGSTVNRQVTLIRRIIDEAVNRDLVHKNPFRALKSRPTADSTQRLPFTLAEVRSLISAAPDDEWKGLITIASQTGIRRGDLMRLTTANVAGSWLKLVPNKTKDSTGELVKLPLTPPCLSWLAGRAPGPLFPKLAKVGTARHGAKRLTARFDGIMGKANVAKVIVLAPGDPPKIGRRSFHSLRHSFVSWLASGDVHADVRQKLAGHSSETVHARYSHHDASLERAVGMLPTL